MSSEKGVPQLPRMLGQRGVVFLLIWMGFSHAYWNVIQGRDVLVEAPCTNPCLSFFMNVKGPYQRVALCSRFLEASSSSVWPFDVFRLFSELARCFKYTLRSSPQYPRGVERKEFFSLKQINKGSLGTV